MCVASALKARVEDGAEEMQMEMYSVTPGTKARPLSWQPLARTSLSLASLNSLASGVKKGFV